MEIRKQVDSGGGGSAGAERDRAPSSLVTSTGQGRTGQVGLGRSKREHSPLQPLEGTGSRCWSCKLPLPLGLSLTF